MRNGSENTNTLAATHRSANPPSRVAQQLLWLWALSGLLIFGLPELQPPIAARYWLLLIVGGVIISIALFAIWLRSANAAAQAVAKPWVLHWSAMLVVGSLAVLNLHYSGAQAEPAARTLLLVCSLGFMTAGLHLRKGMLTLGLALAFCYLYWMMKGEAAGLLAGVVIALGLVSLSRC
ncbi:MAG: hypothetical protein AAF542_04890 [Pseudomonadota bacterium]